jgi:ribosomal protein S18 acetylase RimI-like enzyme
VIELAHEELRFHLPLTPFTRELPVVRPFMQAAVRDQDPALPVFVIERDRTVVGYAVCRVVDIPDAGQGPALPPGRFAHFLSVGVREDIRGSGAGGALVRTAADALAREGASRISAAFVPANALASRFWTALGFRPVWHYYSAVIPPAELT